MALFSRPTARQKEIRRSKAERLPAWYRRIAGRLNLRAFALIFFCALTGAFIVNFGEDELSLREGTWVPRAMTARVEFRIADDDRTVAMRTRARDNAPNYYALDASLLQDIGNRLKNALRVARENADNPEQIRTQAAAISVTLDDAGLAELQRIAGADEAASFEHAVDRALLALRRQPLVQAEERAIRRTGEKAILQDNAEGVERDVSVLRLIFDTDGEGVERAAAAGAAEFPTPLRPSIETSLLNMLAAETPDRFRPLYRYDGERSTLAASEAEDAVTTQYDVYAIGDRLSDAGPITRDELDLLRAESEAYHAWLGSDPLAARNHLRAALGRGLLAFIIILSLGSYIVVHYDERLGNLRRRLVTACTLLICLLLGRLAYLEGVTPFIAVGVQAFVVTLLVITSVRGVAHVTSGLVALTIALAARQDVGFVLTLVATSIVLLFGLRDLRHRGRIIAVGTAAAIVAGLMALLTGLVDQQSLWFMLRTHALWAAGTTLLAAFLVEGLLPHIERLFGVTTNLTLLEWCDPNKPLLRTLAAESPGTYNHSLLVGTLADAAAEAIGANGLLARTGAYYHDIGKINKPGYFVENQAMDLGNRHERLSPAMSHLIIIGHVKDGIEMAKEYNLPTRLRPFIPEHHGTCVVEYFFHAATQARKPGDAAVSDSEFRYPGPKPQSRETAIVMICDAVEGAVRAMPEPTPGRIEDVVDRIIQKRLMDEQFDECDLTFRELAVIHKALTKSLNSIYHGRITYPSEEKSQTRSAS